MTSLPGQQHFHGTDLCPACTRAMLGISLYCSSDSHFAVLSMYTPGAADQPAYLSTPSPGHTGMQEANHTCSTANGLLQELTAAVVLSGSFSNSVLQLQVRRAHVEGELTAAVLLTSR